MTRAKYRAFKCRLGVHRTALRHRCKDCGYDTTPEFWRARKNTDPSAFDALKEAMRRVHEECRVGGNVPTIMYHGVYGWLTSTEQ